MDLFGRDAPEQMPGHLFSSAWELDYSTAKRASIESQNYSVCPRYWYIDAIIPCAKCRREFTFSAEEQQTWYETYRFYVDSFPKQCSDCRRAARRMKRLRQEYNTSIAEALSVPDVDRKIKLVRIIDALQEGRADLPDKVYRNRELLLKQIRNLGGESPISAS